MCTMDLQRALDLDQSRICRSNKLEMMLGPYQVHVCAMHSHRDMHPSAPTSRDTAVRVAI